MPNETTKKQVNGLKPRRIFSTSLKKKLVQNFERNLVTVIQITRQYQVSSAAVYKWIRLYSTQPVGVTQVVQMDSEQQRTALLRQELDEAYRLIGQQQVLIDLNGKVLDHVSEQVGYDVKKKYAPLFSKTFEKTPNAPTQ